MTEVMSDAPAKNDPELGPVTDCPVCQKLRDQAAALTSRQLEEDSVHPNEFIAVFAGRHAHESKTGHTSFGWRFVREARAMAKEFAAEAESSSAKFWEEFSERYLIVPSVPTA